MATVDYNFSEIIGHFLKDDDVISCEKFGNGHINGTFLALCKGAEGEKCYILQHINEVASKIKAIETQINEYLEIANSNTSSEQDFEILSEMISNTANFIDEMTVEQKRNALRSIIHQIVWDGENAHIYYFGENDSDLDISDSDNYKAAAEGLQTRY